MTVHTVEELEEVLRCRNQENADLRAEVRTLKAELHALAERALLPQVSSSAGLAAFGDVALERVRQDRKWGEQNHPDGTGDGMFFAGIPVVEYAELVKEDLALAAEKGRATWAMILLEEVAEAFAEGHPAKVRAELLQVAAVAIAWVQSIDRRRAGARESALARRHARLLAGPADADPASEDGFVEVTGATLYVDEGETA